MANREAEVNDPNGDLLGSIKRQRKLHPIPFQTLAANACVATRTIDTGGGFFIEEQVTSSLTDAHVKKTFQSGLPLRLPGTGEALNACDECHRQYVESYLNRYFEINVCDDCRKADSTFNNNDDGQHAVDESDGDLPQQKERRKYALMTKTTAKDQYLLTDNDLFSRQPPLRFVTRTNPHHERWGKMQLFCRPQVEERAIQVHGSEAALEEALAKRVEKRDAGKRKKFDKKMKELRATVRSSLYKKPKADHVHTFGTEWKKEKEDDDDEGEDEVWCKKCAECGFVQEFEKM